MTNDRRVIKTCHKKTKHVFLSFLSFFRPIPFFFPGEMSKNCRQKIKISNQVFFYYYFSLPSFFASRPNISQVQSLESPLIVIFQLYKIPGLTDFEALKSLNDRSCSSSSLLSASLPFLETCFFFYSCLFFFWARVALMKPIKTSCTQQGDRPAC